MKTITFSAIKGGVGKSSLAIITANILAATGHKVLCIDGDPQNSMTFYYVPDINNSNGSLADVLMGDNINDNITNIQNMNNIDIIPSSLDLVTCKDIYPQALKDNLATIAKSYDYCIIDTAPTFDSVTLNCLEAANVIISPVQFSQFDYKSAVFYKELLIKLDLIDKWFLLFNRFKAIRIGSSSFTAQYLSLFTNTFIKNVLVARIPDSTLIKQYIDARIKITPAKNKIALFEATTAFVKEISGEKRIPISF